MNHLETKPAAVVVDDDTTQPGILAGLLAGAGIEALTYESAEAALAAMDPAAPPALIVTRQYMRGIDGWRFCRLLRSPEFAAFGKVPILMVSAAFAGDPTGRFAADVGADAFLTWPVDGQVFVAQVRALLSGQERSRLPRALIVADAPALAGQIKEALAANGYRVDTALSVREAELAFARTPYDVAVLDDFLPDGTGGDLLDRIRAAQPGCVCLMTTAAPTPERAISWMKRGAAAYVPKPFEPERLIGLCAQSYRERALLRIEDQLEARTRELRESEERYRTLFQNSADAHLLLADGIHVDCNQAALALMRCTREEIVGHSPIDLSPEFQPDGSRSEEKAAAFIQEAFATGSKRFEWVHRRPDGTDFWAEVAATVLTIRGKPMLFASWRDISERKQAEESLRGSEERHRTILGTAMDGFFVNDSAGRFIEVNETYCRMSGYAEQELLSLRVQSVEDVETAADTAAHLQKVLALGQDRFESRHRRKDGSVFDVEVSVQYLSAEEPRFVAFVRDITERKRAAEALQQNRNMLDRILNTIPQSVFWKDRDSRYLGCNLQFAKAVGLESPDKIVGKTDFDLPWPREEAEAYRKDDRFVMDHNRSKTHIIEPLQQADGKRLWIDTSKMPLVDGQGNVYGVLGVYEDISDRKRAEEALREKLAELERLNQLMIGRETRMIELKLEINELCGRLSLPKRYAAPDSTLGKEDSCISPHPNRKP